MRVLTTSRRSTVRGRPPALAGGSRSLIRSHCWSVRSDRYGFRTGLSFWPRSLVASPFAFYNLRKLLASRIAFKRRHKGGAFGALSLSNRAGGGEGRRR